MIHADSVSFLTSTDDRIILFYFISFAQKNKQTNKQKERWQGHRNSCGQLQRARILIKKKAQRYKKNYS